MMAQVLAGFAVLLAGLAAMGGLIPPLADYTYAIVWWGLLPIVDAWNYRSKGLSLWRGRPIHFLLVTIPVSVLFWLLFEILNLASPQWFYKGDIANIHAQSLFGFVSFATVIPIVVEAWWLTSGEFCLPARFSAVFRQWKWAFITVGLLVCAIPFVNRMFWFNQGIWLAPAFVLLPYTKVRPCRSALGFAFAWIAGGLVAGFFWELLNYGARTHWEYIILRGAPHLFQTPAPGYIGFIPFALTALVVFELQQRIPARRTTGVLLYAAALTLLYTLTAMYRERGLWVHF